MGDPPRPKSRDAARDKRRGVKGGDGKDDDSDARDRALLEASLDPTKDADDWGPVLWRLVDEGKVDPTRFGDLTYPMIVALLTRGKSGAKTTQAVQAKKVLADFKGGKYEW